MATPAQTPAAAAAPAERPKRTRSATYDVFELVKTEGGSMWDQIAGEVSARTGREAIVETTANRDEDAKAGTFAYVRHGEFKIQPRKRQAEPVDIWE